MFKNMIGKRSITTTVKIWAGRKEVTGLAGI
jgi:hypothetical protein